MTQAYKGVAPNVPPDSVYLTAIDWSPNSDEEVLDGWNQGRGFKIHEGPACSAADSFRMRAAGWNYGCVVYQPQTAGLTVQYCVIHIETGKQVRFQ